MTNNPLVHILVMAGVTYLIRVLPLLLIRRPIENRWIRSFRFYVPYVTLAVMTFPAILSATGSFWTGLAGFLTAGVLAWLDKGLFRVAAGACAVVFVLELLLPLAGFPIS
jgi:branched-subunit amino acid transport protein